MKIGLYIAKFKKGEMQMKDKILFVTKGGEHCDEGFSYVLELAKTLNVAIETLIILPTHLATQFEDIMAAAAFAEAGDLKTVKEIMDREQTTCREKLNSKIAELARKAEETEITMLCHTSEGDVAAAIKVFLKDKPNIDMVLISPSLSENKKTIDIRKLLKNISKPIVHISRPATAEI
jgi:hypothetical protein